MRIFSVAWFKKIFRIVPLTGTAIDWNSGEVFYRDIAANTTFTFSNLQDKAITLIIKNTSGATVTVALPTGWKDANIDLNVEAGKSNVYTILCANSQPYVSAITKMVFA